MDNLEDIWRVSKLQRERKAKAEAAKAAHLSKMRVCSAGVLCCCPKQGLTLGETTQIVAIAAVHHRNVVTLAYVALIRFMLLFECGS